MNKVAVFAVFALIATFLLILFGYISKELYSFSFNTSRITNDSVFLRDKPREILDKKAWYYDLSKMNNKDFKIMSNELYIHFDLISSQETSRKKFFKLSVNKSDSYSLFCIKQAVAKMNLRYFFVNTKKNANIIIDTDDVSTLHYLVDRLKEFNINSNFAEIWI